MDAMIDPSMSKEVTFMSDKFKGGKKKTENGSEG